MTRSQSPQAEAYQALVEHAEAELELAGRGEIAGMLALGARWEQLTAALPQAPPPAARPALERARLLHERTRVELLRLRESLLVEISTARRAHRTADGYAGTLPSRPRLDRSV